MQNMKHKKIFYICGGRSFFSSQLSRKIYEVLHAFQRFADIDTVFGGDFTGRQPQTSANTGKKSAQGKRNIFKSFVINTGSELRDLRNDRRVFRKLKSLDRPDLVIERSSRFCWAGLRYAKAEHIPYVLEWKDHLLNYSPSLLKSYAKKVEQSKIEKSDYIFVESRVLKEQLIQAGCSEQKIYITYNAVNPDEFIQSPEERKKTRLEFGFAPNDFIIGYCGSYAFYHDSVRMILAAEELQKRNLTQVKWLLVGSGLDYDRCREMAESKGLLDKTVFMVPRVPKEEVPRYLSAFDATILPGSTDIICPIKIMEYMAAETVVILPDYACNREVVTPDCGILFKPFSEQSIADAISKLLQDPEKIPLIGKAARARVCEHFTWDKTYGAVLKQILSRIEQ